MAYSKDFGQIYEGETELMVCIIDPLYGKSEEAEEDGYFSKTLSSYENIYGTKFEEVDVAPGYSLPAYATFIELISEYWPLLVAAFFMAKPASENLLVWRALAKRVRRLFPGNQIALGRNAAAALAVEAVFDELGGIPKTIECKRYYIIDRRDFGKEFEDTHREKRIDLSPSTEYLGMVIHNFKITADGETFCVYIDGKSVIVQKVK